MSWHHAYGAKMREISSWAGRYEADYLHGHTRGVRCIKLLAASGLLATGETAS